MATADTTSAAAETVVAPPVSAAAPERRCRASRRTSPARPSRSVFPPPPRSRPARQESLQSWHRNFLRIASGTLTDLLRLDVDLEMDAIEVQNCAQLVAGRGDDNQAVLFRMRPQPGPGCWTCPCRFPSSSSSA